MNICNLCANANLNIHISVVVGDMLSSAIGTKRPAHDDPINNMLQSTFIHARH